MRVWLQIRFFVVAFRVDLRLIDLFELATRRVFDDRRPGFVSFAKRDSIRVTRSAVLPKSFVRHIR